MAGSRPSPKKSSAERCGARVRAVALLSASVLSASLLSASLLSVRFVQDASAQTQDHAQTQLRPYTVVGDAIPDSLTGAKGDPERGRTIVANRQVGLCLLCHSGPFPQEKFQGTLAPDLSGAGSRSTEGQLRLRIVDASRLKADTIMPPYYRIDGLTRVAPAFQGRTILTAEQIEDVIAYLTTLRDESTIPTSDQKR